MTKKEAKYYTPQCIYENVKFSGFYRCDIGGGCLRYIVRYIDFNIVKWAVFG
jgi:hypothetical protein